MRSVTKPKRIDMEAARDTGTLPIPFSVQELDDIIAAAVERQVDPFAMIRQLVLDDLAR